MATSKELLTNLADEIRVLSGTTEPLGLTEMATSVNDANDEVADQTDLIAQIASALQGKSVPGGGGSSGGGSIETCTVTVTVGGGTGAVYYTAFENETMCAKRIVGDGGVAIENVVCGSSMFFKDIGVLLSATATAGTIMERSGVSMHYEAPREPVDASITVVRD